jgi:hypothetical protein
MVGGGGSKNRKNSSSQPPGVRKKQNQKPEPLVDSLTGVLTHRRNYNTGGQYSPLPYKTVSIRVKS